MQINREGQIREICTALVLKDGTIPKPEINLDTNKRPQVLLIDEVDVFFSESFFGNKYIPAAEIKHDAVSSLIDYIWEERQKKIQELALMSEEEQKKVKETKPYQSVRELKKTQQYKDVLEIFKPDFQFLVEEAVKRLVIDVVQYESPTHQYVIHEGLIGYQQQDLISTNATIGYETLFAYYAMHRIGQIEEKVLNSKKAILLDCATFSFAEVPLEYDIILGVTGTLDTLSKPQEDIIKNIYGIEHKTFSPSVHSSDPEKIFHTVQGVQIIKDSSEYYRSLVNEMDSKYLKFDRPVILFFEDNEKLEKFANSDEFKHKKYQIINEKDNSKEKANKVLKATQLQQITLSTRNFGRGTDFVCYDKVVIAAGGLVVIQTFLSEDLSEETQIRGRTGRQGTSGTYIMFLDLQDLSKFNIEKQEIEESKNTYKTLCQFRDKRIDANNKETTKMRDELKLTHDRSNLVCSQMKQIVKNDAKLSPKDLKALKDHLLGLNQGQSFESEYQPMKVLVLIDCTGSMSMTLQKTKNCVEKMIQETKAELVKNKLGEDIILMKIAGYRNYSSLEQKLFQASPGWTSNTKELQQFLQNTLVIQGGQGNEAIEAGLQFANKEIKENNGIPLSMIIIIGDAAPNTVKDVKENRDGAAASQKDPQYWQKTKDYKEPTHWEKEIQHIKEAEVPVHSFYVLNDKIDEKQKDRQKKYLETEFKKLSVNGGSCSFLDIHDEKKGQEQLKNLFLYYILYRATEINLGEEAAQKAVAHIPIMRHT